jgi:hypothetical protein
VLCVLPLDARALACQSLACGVTRHAHARAQGNTAWTLGSAVCDSTGLSAFNAFSRPQTLHDAPGPACHAGAANARATEQLSAAFAHDGATKRPRESWTATSTPFKNAAGKAPRETVGGALETWLWGTAAPGVVGSMGNIDHTAPRDDALNVELQAIGDAYQRNLQRAHETYQREVQLQEQAYNAAAATSAILRSWRLPTTSPSALTSSALTPRLLQAISPVSLVLALSCLLSHFPATRHARSSPHAAP